jgi:hypothetical protein
MLESFLAKSSQKSATFNLTSDFNEKLASSHIPVKIVLQNFSTLQPAIFVDYGCK